MSMARLEPHVNLVVDACSDITPLVDLAVDLVAEMTADGKTVLQGLFIEDEDLLQAADLPCGRQIAQHTARQSNTSRVEMQELLQRQARRFYRYLEQEAKASQLVWYCTSRSGPGDMLLAYSEASARCQIFARPLVRRLRSPGSMAHHRILLLEDGTSLMLLVLQTVVRQLQDRRVEIVIIRSDAKQGDRPGLLPLIQSWKQDFPLLRVSEYPREKLDALLADPPICDYVILGSSESAELQQRVNRTMGCTLLVVG